MFNTETVNFDRHIKQLLQSFFTKLTEDETLSGHFQQDSAAEHTDTYSMHILQP
jgi:truncated hemoglobin YjbI